MKNTHILEFEKVTLSADASMPTMHDHGHYELYFLLDGTRRVFLEDGFFEMQKNSFIVLPPNCPHKTEGGAYTRVNLNLPPEFLSDRQIKFLTRIQKRAVALDERYLALIRSLLEEACYVQSKNKNDAEEYLRPIAQTIVNFLSLQKTSFVGAGGKAAQKQNRASVEILKVIHFINTHYQTPVTLELLSKKFFVSKTFLCNKFKECTHYTIGEYVLKVRLDNAKFLLVNTDKTIDEISYASGFSSANYFSLIFKRKVGISPMQYRKPR